VEVEERAEVAAKEEVLVHLVAVDDHHHPTPSGMRLLWPYPPSSPFPNSHMYTNPSLQPHSERRWPYNLRLWPQACVRWSLCWRRFRALHFRSTLSHARLPSPRPPDNGLCILSWALALRLPLRISLPLTVLVLQQWPQSNCQRHLPVPEVQRVRV
jgi:hypothetical protein